MSDSTETNWSVGDKVICVDDYCGRVTYGREHTVEKVYKTGRVKLSGLDGQFRDARFIGPGNALVACASSRRWGPFTMRYHRVTPDLLARRAAAEEHEKNVRMLHRLADEVGDIARNSLVFDPAVVQAAKALLDAIEKVEGK